MSVATVPPRASYSVTPDGRYFVVRGRLWRTSNPALDGSTRAGLVSALMAARRAVRDAKAAKRVLGERGPVWWTDGAPDLNRKMVANTTYAAWYACVVGEQIDAD